MLSAVITSYNNAATLDRCLASVGIADEILLLDSFSDDASLDIAAAHDAVIAQQRFAGYGPQKQRAVDLASHDWILLMDADEALSVPAQGEIAAMRDAQQLQGAGYRLRRREWLAWREPIAQHGRWQGPLVRLTDHLRLFDRRQVRLSNHPIHAAPTAAVGTPLLRHELLHWGDAPFARRLAKQQGYARMLAQQQPHRAAAWRQLASPAAALLRDLLLRRYLLDGPLGWRAAWCSMQCSRLKSSA
ncbi:MAG: glycosyltransferase family 2 protein [Gammaproteobacteria bacterium]|nr:glycosyltransferase family 2 protein [Gammaproteobacteria bacterium]